MVFVGALHGVRKSESLVHRLVSDELVVVCLVVGMSEVRFVECVFSFGILEVM